MRKTIEKVLLHLLTDRYAKVGTKSEFSARYKEILPPPCDLQLSKDEIDSVVNVWGKLGKKIDFRYWQFYKKLGMFHPEMVPDNLFVGYMIRTLNPLKLSKCLQNKNHYPILFQEMKQPTVILNSIRGTWYDGQMHIVKGGQIKQLFADIKECIIKPTSETCGGAGICKIELSDNTNIEEVFKRFGENFICQHIVKQCDKTAAFNSSSLNTFRISTFNLNGIVTVENIIFRHGRKGAYVDNGHGGGVCCGIDTEGSFSGWGFDAKSNRYMMAPNGASYAGMRIPEINVLIDAALKYHRQYLPAMGYAAWDFALDENYNPIFIEVNLGWPGIILEQMANGKPLFGNRTEEIIEYVIENMRYLQWKDFLGNWN